MQAETQASRRWLAAPATRRCAFLAAFVSVALAAPSAYSVVSGSPSFSKPQRYPTGKLRGERLHPDAVAVGDVNGDRKHDLVAAGSNFDVQEGGVSVSLNRGRGNFGAARTYRIGYASSAVTIGDLSGDGEPDLATANGDDVSVLINRGGGRFAKSVEYAARQPSDIASGDVNGDGKADLVTANSKAYVNTISVYINRGAGRFSPRVDYRTGRQPVSVAIGDLNGDRSPDLVTANTAGQGLRRPDSVSVFLNRGNGSFRPRRDYRAKGKSNFGPVAIGDLNADGRQDVAVGQDLGEGVSEPKRIAVLVGRGDGSFMRRIDYPTGRTAVDAWAPRGIAIGQLNGDGKLDIAQAKFIDVAVLVNTTPR